jgi:hypothetical protein
VVFATPKLVVTETIQVFYQIEVTLILEHRMLTDGMMRREKSAKINS